MRCDYEFCRSTTTKCRFCLVDEKSVADNIKQAVENSAMTKTAAMRDGFRPAHHQRIRAALACCPNACTMPQIRDIGIIAHLSPADIGDDCSGCGKCESVCREQAVTICGGKAQLVPEKCVGCGQCIKACPQQAIESNKLRFRILAGGKMGRHPRWAREVCVADSSSVAAAVERIIERLDNLGGTLQDEK